MTAALRRTIFAACRELGLDEEARHDLQKRVTGKDSLSAMTAADLKLVVNELKAKGFRLKGGRRPAAPRADLRFVHVLWGLLGKAGKLHQPGREGLNAFIRARFGEKWQSVPVDIDALRDHAQINAVTRALKDWCDREGVKHDR